jgi:hypothetical protein
MSSVVGSGNETEHDFRQRPAEALAASGNGTHNWATILAVI